ncbi:universal stress protein [Halosolutus halophilus]|uniref:universal stress protein n=1 Tax=Halosolutus halophilus TaxID=1552990 RepID=UPI0022351A4F|nr:universal stress protein [Halosolutus halophilus]
MPRSFVEIDVLLPLADREDAHTTCHAVLPYLEGKDCRVHVIHVVHGEKRNADRDAIDERVDAVFDVARECFDGVGIPVSTDVRYGKNVGQTILDAADEYSADAVVLTPRERSIWRRVLSQNVLTTLAKNVDQPLIVIPASD